MTELKIAWDAYRPRLIPYRDEARSAAPAPAPPESRENGKPSEGSPKSPSIVEPQATPVSFHRQTVSPRYAARAYQENIPTSLYTYPLKNLPKREDGPAVTGSVQAPDASVTLVPYEPGSLVDCYI